MPNWAITSIEVSVVIASAEEAEGSVVQIKPLSGIAPATKNPAVLREDAVRDAKRILDHLLVVAGGDLVERPPRRKDVPVGPPPAAPFANRASRVPRWLLLHATDQPSFRELATRLDLSEAIVSRTMRALADDGLVAIGSDPLDARRRLAQLPEPARLLDAFERAIALRRPR